MSERLLADFLEACTRPGCPVCRMIEHYTDVYIWNLVKNQLNITEIRTQFRLNLRFCREHANWLTQTGLVDTFHLAGIYHEILWVSISHLPVYSQPQRQRSGFASWLRRFFNKRLQPDLAPDDRACPACIERQRLDRQILDWLTHSLDQDSIVDVLKTSQGMCLPHLEQLLQSIQTDAERQQIIDIHIEKLEKLRQELTALIRQHENLSNTEPFRMNLDLWAKIVAITTGQSH